jgi:hypothetical protein
LLEIWYKLTGTKESYWGHSNEGLRQFIHRHMNNNYYRMKIANKGEYNEKRYYSYKAYNLSGLSGLSGSEDTIANLLQRMKSIIDNDSLNTHAPELTRIYKYIVKAGELLNIDADGIYKNLNTKEVRQADDNSTQIHAQNTEPQESFTPALTSSFTDYRENTLRYYQNQYYDEIISFNKIKAGEIEPQIEKIKTTGEVGITALKDKLQKYNSEVRVAERNKKKEFTELDEKQQAIIEELVDEGFKKNDGKLTPEQLTFRIEQLEDESLHAYIYEFFPTPVSLVEDMVKEAAIQPGMIILEPEAGKGNIADIIRREFPGNQLDVIEQNGILREILKLKGYNVISDNFLTYNPEIKYDRIVMNPPFANGDDIKHIKHAFALLKPAGKIVAIASFGAAYNNEPSNISFRKYCEKYGTITELPPDTFMNAERSATIRTIKISLQKPLAEEETKSSKISEVVIGDYLQNNYYKDFVYQVVQTTPEYKFKNLVSGKFESYIDLPVFKFSKITEEQANVIVELHNTGKGNGNEPGEISEIQRQHGGEQWKFSGKCNLPNRRPENCTDPELKKKLRLITAREEFTRRPSGQYIEARINELLMPHQRDGVNLAIESLEKNNAFLLVDGTGSGKTIQELTIAHYYLTKYPNHPVIIFTEAEKIITQSFMGDARKLGIENKVQAIRKNFKEVTENKIYILPYYKLSSIIDETHPLRAKINNLGADIKALKKKAKELKAQVDRTDGLSKNAKKDKKQDITKWMNNQQVMSDYIEAMLAWKEYEESVFKDVASNTSIVLFDESHNLKNFNMDELISGMEARRAMIFTKYAGATMFCSATPVDKVDHLFYLKKLNLFQSEEQYVNFLYSIGYHWIEPVYNDSGDIIMLGHWALDKKFASEIQLSAIEKLFEDATEDGLMLKRELELVNMRIQINHVTVPTEAMNELEAIEQYFADKDGDESSAMDRAAVKMEQMRALEPYKISETVRIVDNEITEGRNVVIFVSLTEEGKEEKKWGGRKAGVVRELEKILSEKYCKETVALVVGTGVKGVTQEKIEKDIEEFQKGDKRIVIATHGAGGTGISLDDQYCDQPRTLICVTAPMSANQNVQMLGRIYRANTKSISRAYYIFAPQAPIEEWLEAIIASKMRMLSAVVKGQSEMMNFENLQISETGETAASTVKAIKKTENEEKKHSLWDRVTINGEDLPSKKPYSAKRDIDYWERKIRWGGQEYILFKGKTKADFDRFTAEHNNFITEHGWNKKSSSYEGTYYLAEFNKDNWNFILNFLKPEVAEYTQFTEKLFDVGDIVKTKEDIKEADVTANSYGIIRQVRERKVTEKTSQYYYKVQFENGQFANRLEAYQIELATLKEKSIEAVVGEEKEIIKSKYAISYDYYGDKQLRYPDVYENSITLYYPSTSRYNESGDINFIDGTITYNDHFLNSLPDNKAQEAKEQLQSCLNYVKSLHVSYNNDIRQKNKELKSIFNSLSGLGDELNELEILINNSYR